MLGFGPIGAAPLGSAGVAQTSSILQEVITRLVDVEGILPSLPSELHHFTSLDAAHQIIEGDNVRLSHAEYSNDQTEMAEAKDLIEFQLKSRKPHLFFSAVWDSYTAMAPDLNAFVFCMSEKRELLSQWRAYGQDGRGACITLDTRHLARLVAHTPGLRLNPVVYCRTTQAAMIQGILDCGLAEHERGSNLSIEATVGALVSTTPLMKAPAFGEEREWRLIFMVPQAVLKQPTLRFHARRDFLAPYVELVYLWNEFREIMNAVPEVSTTLSKERQITIPKKLVPLTQVTIGPSGHQQLSVRAFTTLLAQEGLVDVTVSASSMPYRSLT